jgi:hypothetical protein
MKAKRYRSLGNAGLFLEVLSYQGEQTIACRNTDHIRQLSQEEAKVEAEKAGAPARYSGQVIREAPALDRLREVMPLHVPMRNRDIFYKASGFHPRVLRGWLVRMDEFKKVDRGIWKRIT